MLDLQNMEEIPPYVVKMIKYQYNFFKLHFQMRASAEDFKIFESFPLHRQILMAVHFGRAYSDRLTRATKDNMNYFRHLNDLYSREIWYRGNCPEFFDEDDALGTDPVVLPATKNSVVFQNESVKIVQSDSGACTLVVGECNTEAEKGESKNDDGNTNGPTKILSNDDTSIQSMVGDCYVKIERVEISDSESHGSAQSDDRAKDCETVNRQPLATKTDDDDDDNEINCASKNENNETDADDLGAVSSKITGSDNERVHDDYVTGNEQKLGSDTTVTVATKSHVDEKRKKLKNSPASSNGYHCDLCNEPMEESSPKSYSCVLSPKAELKTLEKKKKRTITNMNTNTISSEGKKHTSQETPDVKISICQKCRKTFEKNVG